MVQLGITMPLTSVASKSVLSSNADVPSTKARLDLVSLGNSLW